MTFLFLPSRHSQPLLRRENKNFRYFASAEDPEIEEISRKTNSSEATNDTKVVEEEQRIEELMEQATQEFRSYLKNQVWEKINH